MKWYYPQILTKFSYAMSVRDRHLLKSFGFDAQFEERGREMVFQKSNKMSIHNTDKCYLIFKTSNDYKTGTALCLDKNYRWKVVALGNGKTISSH